jgi:hypothetical protein
VVDGKPATFLVYPIYADDQMGTLEGTGEVVGIFDDFQRRYRILDAKGSVSRDYQNYMPKRVWSASKSMHEWEDTQSDHLTRHWYYSPTTPAHAQKWYPRGDSNPRQTV